MLGVQLSPKANDFLDASSGVAENDPVSCEPLDGELSGEALDHRVRPAKVHSFKGLDEAVARRGDRFFRAVRHEDVAKQRYLAFSSSRFNAGVSVQPGAGCDLVEIGRWPHEPDLSEAGG